MKGNREPVEDVPDVWTDGYCWEVNVSDGKGQVINGSNGGVVLVAVKHRIDDND